jgi:hypothetical protein
MKNRRGILFVLVILLLLSAALIAWRHADAMGWYIDRARTYLAVLIHPIQSAPEVNAEVLASTLAPDSAETPTPLFAVNVPQPVTVEALPSSKFLPPPAFDEKNDYQAWNNCGPATLALALRFWGWQGDQYTVAAVVKPSEEDKNVNIDELAAYASREAGLATAIRVAGDLATLKRLIGAGFPVMVETSFQLTESFWPGDDRWSSHFTLLTGYDDALSAFTAQDAFLGPNAVIAYTKLSEDWHSFNNVYLVLYPADAQDQIATLLGADWSEATNLQKALALASTATQNNPRDAIAWFNLGTTLTALEKYDQAWQAFEKARALGLPQRMLRYQFTPFIAAYETGHIQDLLNLSAYALQVTPTSEEALYWQGKAFLALQQNARARASFQQALSLRPDYPEAVEGLNAAN